MFSDIKKFLQKAYQNKYAIPHFNINNLEFAKYILEACEEVKSPVIIGVSESAVQYMGGYHVVHDMVLALINDLEISIPVGLILDHGRTFEACKKAIDAGFNGVMVSADNIELSNNIELTNRVIAYARDKHIYVEGEVGDIPSSGHATTSISVNDAIMLVNDTDIDALAPALGSVHGIYSEEVKIDFDEMKVINDNTQIPLVLHGGSGIPDYLIIKSIENGVAKININTDFQIAWADAVRKYLIEDSKVYDPRKINGAAKQRIMEVAKSKVLLFGSNFKA